MAILKFNIFENVQQAKSLLLKHKVDKKNTTYLFLKNLTQKNPGYLGFFVKMWLEKNVDMTSIENLYNSLDQPYINKLSKSVIEYTEWEELQDDIITAKNEYKVKKIKDELPIIQRDIVDSAKKNVFNDLFIRLYDRKDNKIFLNKVSRYKNYKSFYDALTNFVNSIVNNGFESILKRVERESIKIFYKDKENDIIIVKVNDYLELNRIASDSSWCILDRHTFERYTDGFNRQFVIFLTDLNDNYRKIGLTYGIKYDTAHLLDDEFISEFELSKILLERNIKLSLFKITDSEIDYEMDVVDLLSYGLSAKDIFKNKKLYTKTDVERIRKKPYFSDNISIIESRIKIVYKDDIEKNLDWIGDNIFRIKLNDKNIIDFDFFVNKINPTPRQIKNFNINDLNIKNVFDSDLIRFIEVIKNKRLEDINFNNYPLDVILYIFRFYGIGPSFIPFDELVTYISGSDITYYKKVIEFLILNGYNLEEKDYILLAQKMRFGNRWRNPLDEWFGLLEKFPILKTHVDGLVKSILSDDRDYDYKRINKIESINIASINSEYIKNYPKLEEKKIIKSKIELFGKIVYDVTVSNYNRRSSKQLISYYKLDIDEISPKFLVDEFYEYLKDYYFRLDQYTYLNQAIYFISSLIKTNNIEKLNKLNISLNINSVKKLIRIFLDIKKYNGNSYLTEEFKLNSKEFEIFSQWLIQSRKSFKLEAINYIATDLDLIQHSAVGLLYYYHDWGFQMYFNLVKKSKNIKRKLLDDGNYLYESNKIMYFEEILHYMSVEGMVTELDEMKNKIKDGIVLTNKELEKLNSSFLHISLF
jgi:hypothetical protein